MRLSRRVSNYQTSRRHFPEDSNFQSPLRELNFLHLQIVQNEKRKSPFQTIMHDGV